MARPGRPRSADPPAAVLSDADLGIRGRRRSQSFSADDTDMLAEMDAAVGNPSSAPSLPKAASGPGSSGAGQLSDRTLAIIGMRERGSAAAAVAAASSPSRPVTQADREEAALAEEERRAMVASVIRRPVMASSSGRDGKDYSMTVKILLLGDAGVGKTSMMLRYSENTFSINMMATAGVAYKAEMLDIQGQRVKCQMWDTAGQQDFHVITQAYYKGAHGIVLVYDASEQDQASFHNMQYWMDNISKHASPRVHKVLVANKVDLPRGVTADIGRAAGQHYGIDYFECSAKSGLNVEHVFHSVAAACVRSQLARVASKAASQGADAASPSAPGAAAASPPPEVTAKQVKHLKDGKEKKPCTIM